VFSWGINILDQLLEQQISESLYIYIYIFDPEQTIIILAVENLDFPDQQGG
jgi:hypothetical protein